MLDQFVGRSNIVALCFAQGIDQQINGLFPLASLHQFDKLILARNVNLAGFQHFTQCLLAFF